MIIADTSGLLALFNRREPQHRQVAEAVRRLNSSHELLVVSPFVVAELDYLIGTRLGIDAELAVLGEFTTGAYELASISGDDIAGCAEVIARYREHAIGVADASLVVLARRYETRTLLTLDRRHFETLRPLDGGRFRLLPSR